MAKVWSPSIGTGYVGQILHGDARATEMVPRAIHVVIKREKNTGRTLRDQSEDRRQMEASHDDRLNVPTKPEIVAFIPLQLHHAAGHDL
jgi:hypothetical protein